jgi:hypothetical protein
MFQEDLARALWDKKFYESEIERNTPKKKTRVVESVDEMGNPVSRQEEYMDGEDDGANPSRQQGIAEINKRIARIREFDDARNQTVNLAADQARRNIAERLSGVKANTNARGLLYSNYRGGQEAKERAANASQLGRNVADINNQFERAYDQNQQGLLTNQIGDYKNSVDQSMQSYKKALKDYQNRSGTASAIGSAVGTVGGALLSPI